MMPETTKSFKTNGSLLYVYVRMGVCLRSATKDLLSNANMSLKLMRYLRETLYLYELVFFYSLFLLWIGQKFQHL